MLKLGKRLHTQPTRRRLGCTISLNDWQILEGMAVAPSAHMLALALLSTLSVLPAPNQSASAEPPTTLKKESVVAPSHGREGRSARLLDPETQAKVQALDHRIRALGPTSGQKALRGLAIGGAAVVFAAGVATVTVLVVGMALGITRGFGGMFAGAYIMATIILQHVPPAVWVIVAAVAAVAGVSFLIERLSSSSQREEIARLRQERRALLRGEPRAELQPVPVSMVKVASF